MMLRTQVFLSTFGAIRQNFALKRHTMSCTTLPLSERSERWRQFSARSWSLSNPIMFHAQRLRPIPSS